MFDNALPTSYYKKLAPINEEHGIYVAQHVETHKVYVLKELKIYSMPVYEQLFFHPLQGIPRIYALYEKDGVLTCVEEYISGDTLEEIIHTCGSVPEDEAVHIVSDLCLILDKLHRQSLPIVHRDIKPSNIVITESKQVVLLDLNAARVFSDEKERDTKLLGTEGYAAPEQYGFGESSQSSDIYAVGMLLIHMLTGKVSRTVPPGKLKKVITKCLNVDPGDRYASAKDLYHALKRVSHTHRIVL